MVLALEGTLIGLFFFGMLLNVILTRKAWADWSSNDDYMQSLAVNQIRPNLNDRNIAVVARVTLTQEIRFAFAKLCMLAGMVFLLFMPCRCITDETSANWIAALACWNGAGVLWLWNSRERERTRVQLDVGRKGGER